MRSTAWHTDRRVSVIIPTLQRSPRLASLVDRLADEPAVLEVIVINNAPAPLHWESERVRVIDNAANLYVNPSWNLGATIAEGDILAISNDDIDFDPAFLSYATRLLDRRRIGIVAPSERASVRFACGPMEKETGAPPPVGLRDSDGAQARRLRTDSRRPGVLWR